METGIINGELAPIAKVKIKTEGVNAVVYLDGKKVNGLIGYEIIHDRTISQMPVIRLNLQSELDIETGMIPELPEPWKYCYSFNHGISEEELLKIEEETENRKRSGRCESKRVQQKDCF